MKDHVFYAHELQPGTLTPVLRDLQVSVWPFFVLFLSLVLLVYLRTISTRHFFQVIKSFFSLGYTHQLIREEYRLNKGSSLALMCIAICSASLFITKANGIYGAFMYKLPSFLQFLVFILIIILVYLFKILINHLVAFISNQSQELNEYFFNVVLMNKATGFCLFPLVIGLYYTDINVNYLFLAGIAVTLFFYFMRVYRGAVIGRGQKGVSIFHLFLYLCVLELLPFIVFVKILIGRI